MDNNRHPIPQNVTQFQFKLIGDMTIKQFAYLAGNLIAATFFWLLPFPLFIKFPFTFLFAFLGVALAFIPYQGRPLDKWIINFFRAVFSPSQYAFHLPKKSPLPPQPQPVPQPIPQVQPQPIPQPTPQPTPQTVPLPKPVIIKTPAKILPSAPQVSNLISGIVLDYKGSILPNILVEVKDHEGNLVRAFKTNKLGQFMAATQLSDGIYSISFEDPQNKFQFSPVSVVLKDNIIQPIEVKSINPREELRKKVFA